MAYSNVQTGVDSSGKPIYSSGAGDAPTAVASPVAPTATPTLTQAQLDAQNASKGITQFNPGPISVAGLAGSSPTPIVPVQPNTPAIPDLSSLMVQETPAQQQQDELGKLITGLNNTEAGKSADITSANTAAGVDTIQQSINDLNTSALQLKNDTAAAKLQQEDRFAPTFAISGDQARIDRESAVKALTLSSLSDVLQNNLVAAQNKANQAVAAKYGPIEAQIAAATANLKLLQDSPSTSVQEKNQATQLAVALAAYNAKVADDKATATAVITAAQDAAKNAQYFTATAQYPTLSSALNAIASATSPVTAAQIASSVGLTAAAKLDTSVIEAGGRKLLVNNQTGATVKDLGAVTTGGGVGTSIRSGTLNYSAQDQADDSKSLNASRGTDGYVDPNLYLKLYNAWINAGGQLEDFLKTYPPVNYINPTNTFLPKFLMPKATSAFEQF